jgi:hypothetical protein
MCQTNACGCASADSAVPAAVVTVVLVGAAVSSAAALITGAMLAILAALGVLSVAGIAGLVYLLRRDRVVLWQPAPARRVTARPALPALPEPQPAPALASAPRAIEAPAAARVMAATVSSPDRNAAGMAQVR